MADIKLKDINQLADWNSKELRKLKITVKNRIQAFDASANPKELSNSHPLRCFSVEQCQELLQNILKAEKNLKS